MSRSQVSFAAFVQHIVCPPPPASANGSVLSLAAPTEPGVGVDTPQAYVGVFHALVRPSSALLAGGWRGDWFIDFATDGCLDAPQYLPHGGHRSMSVFDGAMADGRFLSRRDL